MVCGAAWLSAAAWFGMVRPVRHASISAVCGISVVVSLRSLCARGFRQGGDDRRGERISRLRVRRRRLALARPSVAPRHAIRIGALATKREIDRAGLLRDGGVLLGRKRWRYLRHDGPEHVMAFAPTRSGKGVGLRSEEH